MISRPQLKNGYTYEMKYGRIPELRRFQQQGLGVFFANSYIAIYICVYLGFILSVRTVV